MLSGRQDSNLRPHAPKARALPTELLPVIRRPVRVRTLNLQIRILVLFRIELQVVLWKRLDLNQHPRIFSPLHRPTLLRFHLSSEQESNLLIDASNAPTLQAIVITR